MPSDLVLLPSQTSLLNPSLCHIGCKQDAPMQSFLQLSTGGALQSSQEVLLFCLVAAIFIALALGGVVFWLTVYESGKSLAQDLEFAEDSTEKTSKRRYSGLKKVSGAARLFPSHLVGSEFSLTGSLTTQPQDQMIKVNDAQGSVIGRALVCETGDDPGILIEDAFRAPLAFIDTSEVVDESNASPTLHIHKLGDDEGTFCIIRHEDNSRLVIRGRRGKLLLAFQGDISGNSFDAVDESSRLVGTVQRKQSTSNVVTMPQADAGVMICGLLALGKLGKIGMAELKFAT